MKWLKRIIATLFLLLSLICLTFVMGPRPSYDAVSPDPIEGEVALSEVEGYVQQMEAPYSNIRPDNAARIIWADSIRKTPYSIVYLHGFTASQGEGYPIHQNVAKQFGCNLFLARLHNHGLTGKDAFKITPAKLLQSAKEAIRIGRSIGEEVILMSTSTGGTLSIYLAPEDEHIAGLVMLSPNISIASPAANLLTGPWGLELTHQIIGEYRRLDRGPIYEQYWTHHYRSDAVVALQNLIDQTMTPEVFQKVEIPMLVAYYYKNETEQDQVVSIEAIQDFLTQVKTPKSDIMEVPVPEAGKHVMGSSHVNEHWESTQNVILPFMEEYFAKGKVAPSLPSPATPSKLDQPQGVTQ